MNNETTFTVQLTKTIKITGNIHNDIVEFDETYLGEYLNYWSDWTTYKYKAQYDLKTNQLIAFVLNGKHWTDYLHCYKKKGQKEADKMTGVYLDYKNSYRARLYYKRFKKALRMYKGEIEEYIPKPKNKVKDTLTILCYNSFDHRYVRRQIQLNNDGTVPKKYQKNIPVTYRGANKLFEEYTKAYKEYEELKDKMAKLVLTYKKRRT